MSAVLAVRSPSVADWRRGGKQPQFPMRGPRIGRGRLKPPVRIVHKRGLPQTGVAAIS